MIANAIELLSVFGWWAGMVICFALCCFLFEWLKKRLPKLARMTLDMLFYAIALFLIGTVFHEFKSGLAAQTGAREHYGNCLTFAILTAVYLYWLYCNRYADAEKPIIPYNSKGNTQN